MPRSRFLLPGLRMLVWMLLGGFAAGPLCGQSTSTVACWGDSLTQGNGIAGYCDHLATLLGKTTYDMGIPGQRSGDIAVRMNAYAGKSAQTFGAKFTIPTKGNVVVQWADANHIPTYKLVNVGVGYPSGVAIKTTVAGTAYTLQCVNTSSTATTAKCWMKKYPAVAVAVPAGNAWTVDTGQLLSGTNLIRAGANNLGDCPLSGATLSNCRILADVAAMVAAVTAAGGGYRVLGVQNAAWATHGTNGYAIVQAINTAEAAAYGGGYVLDAKPYYGGHFIDIRKNLVAATCAQSDGVDAWECAQDVPGHAVRYPQVGAATLAASMATSDKEFDYSGSVTAIVKIDSEYLRCNKYTTGQCVSATRGLGGTSAVAHSQGVAMTLWDNLHENATGYELDAALVKASLEAKAASVPAAPSGLKATAGTAQVALSWTAVSGATKYTVKRASSATGTFSSIGTVTAASFTDTVSAALVPGVTYYYAVTATNATGEGKATSAVSAKPLFAAPTALTAASGLMQVGLKWTGSTGATKYLVQRSTTSGSGYKTIATVATTSFTDTKSTSLVGGTKFYYVVAAGNAVATSAVSSAAQATPLASGTAVSVTVNTLANRHTISDYIYGANFPPSTDYIKTTGLTMSRWGGNNTSRYNWKLNVTNLDSDWYFENYTWGDTGVAKSGSLGFVSNVVGAGSAPVMTIPMLSWVAKDAYSNSFSVKKYGSQCARDSWRTDAGDGLKTDCSTEITGNVATDAHVPLADAPGSNDKSGTVYRSQWVTSLKAKFGTTQPHFYDLDNEPDIWSGTHRDVHPDATGYDELASAIYDVGHVIKKYDASAIRLAPVMCCWWFYWNSADTNEKGIHGGEDFLPWLLNAVLFKDAVAGSRSLDVFDVHAYFNGANPSGMTLAKTRAAALRETRDWWDSTYTSESGTVNQDYATHTEPSKRIAFVIPRMRALANSIYPDTPVAFTEWSGATLMGNSSFSSQAESDITTGLADAEAYGILGRERMYAASRWEYAQAGTPAYYALMLYRNADGSHNGFQPLSVKATHDASANLFSVYASTNAAGTKMTLMVVNKDPSNSAAVSFNVAGFTPSTMKTYTVSSASSAKITASGSQSWLGTQIFAPYSMTLIVATGTSSTKAAEEWDLNPDTLMANTSSTVTIAPTLTSGTGTVTMTSATGATGLTLSLTQPKITAKTDGTVTIKTPSTPGLYSFTVTAKDSGGAVQTQSGWVIATVPKATLTKTGDGQSAAKGSKVALTATFVPGSSGATAQYQDLLFTASAGTLSSRIVRTNASGKATVTLTLPATAGKVTVTAVGHTFWGAPSATFTVTAK